MTDELKAAIESGLRKCRVEDAPVSLIRAHDLFHVTHMVADALVDVLAARDRRVRAEAVAYERMQQADRLQNAQGALDSLKHQTERIAGKREGVTLALSYIEEDQRMAESQREADA